MRVEKLAEVRQYDEPETSIALKPLKDLKIEEWHDLISDFKNSLLECRHKSES